MLFFDAGGARGKSRKKRIGVSPSVARDGLHGVTGKRHVRHHAELAKAVKKTGLQREKWASFHLMTWG